MLRSGTRRTPTSGAFDGLLRLRGDPGGFKSRTDRVSRLFTGRPAAPGPERRVHLCRWGRPAACGTRESLLAPLHHGQLPVIESRTAEAYLAGSSSIMLVDPRKPHRDMDHDPVCTRVRSRARPMPSPAVRSWYRSLSPFRTGMRSRWQRTVSIRDDAYLSTASLSDHSDLNTQMITRGRGPQPSTSNPRTPRVAPVPHLGDALAIRCGLGGLGGMRPA